VEDTELLDALEELLVDAAIEEDDIEGLEDGLEDGLELPPPRLLELTGFIDAELLESSEETIGAGSSEFEQAKKAPPATIASKNKTPDTFFI